MGRSQSFCLLAGCPCCLLCWQSLLLFCHFPWVYQTFVNSLLFTGKEGFVRLGAQVVLPLCVQEHIEAVVLDSTNTAVICFWDLSNRHVDARGYCHGFAASLGSVESTRRLMVQNCASVLVFRQWEAGVLCLGCSDSACRRHSPGCALIYCRTWTHMIRHCMFSTIWI